MEKYTSKIYISFEDMQDNIPDVQIFYKSGFVFITKLQKKALLIREILKN